MRTPSLHLRRLHCTSCNAHQTGGLQLVQALLGLSHDIIARLWAALAAHTSCTAGHGAPKDEGRASLSLPVQL